MPAFCEVALPVPLDRTFTYAVRDERQPARGARVIVPFRNEKLIGVVTVADSVAPVDFEAKFLDAVLDEEPLLSDHLLSLAEWIAQYYLAPLGEVLRGMLPLMAEVRRTVLYRITDLGRDVLAGSLDGDSSSRKPRKRSSKRSANPSDVNPDTQEPDTQNPDTQEMARCVLERLSAGQPVKVSVLRAATEAPLSVLASLTRKKWIARETAAVERDARRTERFAVLIPEARLPRLTENQQAILAELTARGRRDAPR